MKNSKPSLVFIAVCTSVLFSANTLAGTETSSWTWQFSGCSSSDSSQCNDDTTNGLVSGNNGGKWKFDGSSTSSGANATTVQAWSSTKDMPSEGGLPGGDNISPDQLEVAGLRHYGGGLGVVNVETGSGQPNHAFDGYKDNNGSSYEWDSMDAVLLSFDQLTTLTSVTFGWAQTDADFSLMAYSGSGTPDLANKSYFDLDVNGWSLVGHYYYSGNGSDDATGLIPGPLTYAVNDGSTTYSSSYYLLSVLNPELNTDCSGGTNTRTCAADAGNDYFKLLALTGTTTTTTTSSGNPSIPVPPTALLFLAALPLIRLTQRTKAA